MPQNLLFLTQIQSKNPYIHGSHLSSTLSKLEFLLKQGADPNTGFADTPLYIACKAGNKAIVSLFLNYGGLLYKPGSHCSPIEALFNGNHVHILKELHSIQVENISTFATCYVSPLLLDFVLERKLDLFNNKRIYFFVFFVVNFSNACAYGCRDWFFRAFAPFD